MSINHEIEDMKSDNGGISCEPLISRRALLESMERLWNKKIAEDVVLNRVYYTILNTRSDIKVDMLINVMGDLAKMRSDAIELAIKYEQNSVSPRVG